MQAPEIFDPDVPMHRMNTDEEVGPWEENPDSSENQLEEEESEEEEDWVEDSGDEEPEEPAGGRRPPRRAPAAQQRLPEARGATGRGTPNGYSRPRRAESQDTSCTKLAGASADRWS